MPTVILSPSKDPERSRGASAQRSVFFVAAIALTLPACATHTGAQAPAAATAAPPAHRIVSLIPSLTDDLCAIGAAKQLAGVSQYTDAPCAKSLPVIGNFSSVDTERIVQLHPAVAVGIPAQRFMTASLRRAGIRTVLLKDDSLADLYGDISQLGSLSGRSSQAASLIASLKARTAQLQASEHFKRRPTVFFVEQAQPVWTVGPQSYIATLIDLAGGRNAVPSLPQAYAQYSPEALLRLQPDAIVATADAHLNAVIAREPWRSLHAVREGNVFILTDADILVRPGPRYNEGLAWLIAHLRPIANK